MFKFVPVTISTH